MGCGGLEGWARWRPRRERGLGARRCGLGLRGCPGLGGAAGLAGGSGGAPVDLDGGRAEGCVSGGAVRVASLAASGEERPVL